MVHERPLLSYDQALLKVARSLTRARSGPLWFDWVEEISDEPEALIPSTVAELLSAHAYVRRSELRRDCDARISSLSASMDEMTAYVLPHLHVHQESLLRLRELEVNFGVRFARGPLVLGLVNPRTHIFRNAVRDIYRYALTHAKLQRSLS